MGAFALALAAPDAAQILNAATISITVPKDIAWVADEGGSLKRAIPTDRHNIHITFLKSTA